MFCFQHLCQQNPVLLISVGLSFSPSPFVVTRSIYTHDLTKKIYGISGSERVNDLELFPLPVTNSLDAPTPFAKYPFFNLSFSTSNFATVSLSLSTSERFLLIIAIFKIKAYSRMNGTNPHSPVELQPEMHAESHLEEHPMSLL